MSPLLRAFVDEVRDNPDAARELAEVLVPYVLEHAEPDTWLDTRAAAAYLGLSKHALHRLTAARRIPFSQDGPGARCYFKRSDLERWRQHCSMSSTSV